MILTRNKIPPPLKLEFTEQYPGWLGNLRNYEELFGYQFLAGQDEKKRFDGGYLILTNEKKEQIHLSGTIDLFSRHRNKWFKPVYKSSWIALIINPYEEIYYKVNWKHKEVFKINVIGFLDNFIVQFNLKENNVLT
jgi:hypothetical protein